MSINKIRSDFKDYIVNNNLKAAVIGISGGLDSAVNAALLYPVCKELGIPLIGRFIHIDSNKPIEKKTANAIGKAFCTDYRTVDLTDSWESFPIDTFEINPIRSGNIKARMRMMYLRDLAHAHSGIMIDNSNWTEYNLGFFTIADGGDYSPLFYYWKTEVYEIAKELQKEYNDSFRGDCLQMAIEMIPTDGLGISNSDLEQIGAESYIQVDNILQELLAWKYLSGKRGDQFGPTWTMRDAFLEEQQMLDTPIKVIIAVTDRHFNSEFKRNSLPVKIKRDEI